MTHQHRCACRSQSIVTPSALQHMKGRCRPLKQHPSPHPQKVSTKLPHRSSPSCANMSRVYLTLRSAYCKNSWLKRQRVFSGMATSKILICCSGTENGGLLGTIPGSGQGATAARSSAAAAKEVPSEPALALRSSGNRKWGPAQFAPAATPPSQPAGSAAPSVGVLFRALVTVCQILMAIRLRT
jgi:hypothetical protein